MNELYKKEICINCSNENCKNRIETNRTQDLCIEQINTITTTKCKDFICKNKRKKRLARVVEYENRRYIKKKRCRNV